MRSINTAASLALAVALTGCGGTSSETGQHGAVRADCQEGVRYQKIIYIESGYVDSVGDQIGTARLGKCDDQGKDAAGLTFGEGARTVQVWEVGKIDPRWAIARKTVNGIQVLLAQEVEGQERARMLARLGLDD